MPPLEEQERPKGTFIGRQVEKIKVESNTKTQSTANKVSNFVKTMFKAIANAFANFYNKVANFFHKDSRKVEQAPTKIEAPAIKAPIEEDAVIAASVQIDPMEAEQEPGERKPTANTSTPWITAGKSALALGSIALGGYAASSYFGGMANATMNRLPSPSDFTCPANFTCPNPANAIAPLLLSMAANTSKPSVESLAAKPAPTAPILETYSNPDWIISTSKKPLLPTSSIREQITHFAKDRFNAMGVCLSNGYDWFFNSHLENNHSSADLPKGNIFPSSDKEGIVKRFVKKDLQSTI